MRIAALIITATLSFTSFYAQEKSYRSYGMDVDEESAPKGLDVGEIAPNISLKDTEGELHDLYNVLEQKEVLVFFYRGQWCPHCNRYLSQLQDSLEFILATGVEIWAITPENMENARSTKEKTGASYPILSDSLEKAMREYKVIFDVTGRYKAMISVGTFTNIASANGQEEARLPVPATYLIGKDRRIHYRYFDYDFSKRAGVGEILRAIENTQNQTSP